MKRRQWLIDIRLENGMSQNDVAVQAGIHRVTYGQFETGRRNPSVPTAQRIAKVLDFDWTIFFTDNGCVSHHKGA